MTEDQKRHIDKFNAVIGECEVYLFAPRDKDLQKDACKELEQLMTRLKELKRQAVTDQHEDFANLLLGCECVADCVHAQLMMWILLKEEKADEAWDCLVSAQVSAGGAAKAHKYFEHLVQQVGRLEMIEQLIFPPQVFVSAGFIVRQQECSICGSEYGECEHLAGKPYLGKFCHIIARGLTGDHVAVVKNPADKTCRVMRFPVEGGERNRMTWKMEPTLLEDKKVSDGKSNPKT